MLLGWNVIVLSLACVGQPAEDTSLMTTITTPQNACDDIPETYCDLTAY